MKELNLADCNWKKLCKFVRGIGLEIHEGRGHTKVFYKNKFITLIPRHNSIKKTTVKEILKDIKRKTLTKQKWITKKQQNQPRKN